MTPHQKIMRAARNATGLRLTAIEVAELSMDSAISMCAENDDIADQDVKRIIRNATRGQRPYACMCHNFQGEHEDGCVNSNRLTPTLPLSAKRRTRGPSQREMDEHSAATERQIQEGKY